MANPGRFVQTNPADLMSRVPGPGSDIDRYLADIAQRIRDIAQALAPVGEKPSPIGEPPLASSIRITHFTRARGPVYLIGSTLKKAGWVHGKLGTSGNQPGTPPHVISPRGQHLAFYWKRMGRFVVLRYPTKDGKTGVSHPGIALSPNPPNKGVQRFLTDARDRVLATIR